tara:strand:+ start:1800 stop:2081 length:282 start_codon:yes stop_codon:yes gene_type:complete
MKSLVRAGNDIIKVILECERNLDDLPIVVGRIGTDVKIHGHPIPTPLILDLINEFLNDRTERNKIKGLEGFDEEKLEMAFNKVSRKWSGETEN